MEEHYRFYKRKFKNALEPILVMLINHKKSMTAKTWNDSVESTQSSIINNPIEFLGNDLPDKKMTSTLVQVIFKEFIQNTGLS